MNHQKPISLGGRVPFSWENQPGISKVTPHVEESSPKLPPPPISSDTPRALSHGLYVPLPPCPFQPPQRRGGGKRDQDDDPFLAAMVECTKSVKRAGRKGGSKGRKRDGWLGFGILSCKSSCGVREKNLVRMSQLPAFGPEEK